MATRNKPKAPDDLSSKQRRILLELEQIASLLRLDDGRIKEYEREERTPRLEFMTRHFIIGEVVTQYTLIDEYLNSQLCDYFFGRGKNYIKLWKTKEFQNFNYYVLETLTLMEKLRFVKAITKLPKSVAANIERINGLRNGLAHAFFPENLRAAKPVYKGLNIFTFEGIRLFVDDMARLFCYFHGIKASKVDTVKEPIFIAD
jgi:hypothetical protein